VLTAWIGANRTQSMVAEMKATLAILNFFDQAFECIAQAQGLAGFAAQQMQNQLERGLATNARKSRKGIDGILHQLRPQFHGPKIATANEDPCLS